MSTQINKIISITSKETDVDIVILKNPRNNLIPVKIKINPTPYLIHLNIESSFTSKKYKLLKPKIAKIFEL